MSAAIMTQLPKEGVHSQHGDILGDPGSDVGGGVAPLPTGHLHNIIH